MLYVVGFVHLQAPLHYVGEGKARKALSAY